MNKISIIKSSIITSAVSYLCQKAVCFLPDDVYERLCELYEQETSSTARSFLEEILLNAYLAEKTTRPICQDTGITVVFAEIGQNVHIEGDDLETAINKGVETGYKDGFLRKSTVHDAVFQRINTGTNTPAIIHTKIVQGNTIKLSVLPKGSGSENMSAVKMMKPSDGIDEIVNFVVETVKNAGPNSCPPLHIGVGIGGTMEYAGILAKKALLNKAEPESELELKIFREVQKTCVGAEGFGGDSTVFGVSVETYSCHIASLPVAVNLNCHASRHAEMIIDENTVVPEKIIPESKIPFKHKEIDYSGYKKLQLPLDNSDISQLKAGDRVLLTGELYTARDSAHRKFQECAEKGENMPIDVKGQTIYYTGPCPAKGNEVIGPAGPTTSERMDVYTPMLLNAGLKAIIGKGFRSQEVIDSIVSNKAVYFVATGGVGCLLAEKIKFAEVIAYPELGAEAVYRLLVEDFPVIVCIDSFGNNLYEGL